MTNWASKNRNWEKYEPIDFSRLDRDDYKFKTSKNMLTKPFWQSKTIWFNIVVTAIGVATSLSSVATFDKYATVLGLVTVIGNVILRTWFTNSSIATPATPAQ